jgi:hypothetical protein
LKYKWFAVLPKSEEEEEMVLVDTTRKCEMEIIDQKATWNERELLRSFVWREKQPRKSFNLFCWKWQSCPFPIQLWEDNSARLGFWGYLWQAVKWTKSHSIFNSEINNVKHNSQYHELHVSKSWGNAFF